MKTFNVYTGDGNMGTSRDHEIEAESLDDAVKAYMAGVAEDKRDWFDDPDGGEGDEHHAVLSIYETPDGERAYNGGCYFVAEIWDAEHDPRVQPV